MTKIGIIEDDDADANRRYGQLNASHEVHILMLGKGKMFRPGIVSLLQRGGKFNPERIYFDLEQMPPMDVYFCDGLKGDCFEMADRFGRDKTYINTTNYDLEKQAVEQGYRTLNTPIEEILSNLERKVKS